MLARTPAAGSMPRQARQARLSAPPRPTARAAAGPFNATTAAAPAPPSADAASAAAAAAAASAAHGAAANPPAPAGSDDFAAFERFIVDSQDRILREAEALDGSGRAFLRDRWERPNGGGYGVTAVLEGGDLLEKAAANITVVRGRLSPQRAQAMSSRGRGAIDPRGGQAYGAAALSLVFHPRHPHVPTLRADVRLFQVFSGDDRGAAGGQPPLSWYGGGCDLTPVLLYEDDARAFHAHWRAVCDAHLRPTLYRELKPWCDRYFYVTSRREHRGIGGIFFDDLERTGGTAAGGGDGGEQRQQDGAGAAAAAAAGNKDVGAPLSTAAARRGEFDPAAFARDVLANVLPSWRDIAAVRRGLDHTEAERKWQLERRGRYLEFNLLDDRGVRFGLADGAGRVESIMVSAPPLIAWSYGVVPPPGSREEATLELLKGAPKEWV